MKDILEKVSEYIKTHLIEDVFINDKNIKEFKRYNTSGKFRCCLCKKDVFADDSYSNQGDRLICFNCYHKFKSCKEARKWMNREDN